MEDKNQIKKQMEISKRQELASMDKKVEEYKNYLAYVQKRKID